MGRIWMPGGGGGKGAKLEAVTAGAYDVREGAVIVDKNGNPVTGLVPTRNRWTANLPINGQVTIPWGIHDGNGLVTQNIPTQAAMTLNPGTTQKTAYVYQKYMLGNITVPAINIPAAYIKKGQRITFPDGSSVVGTFEGYVAKETVIYSKDLSQNSGNIDGFSVPDKCGISGGSLWWNTSAIIKTNKEYDLGQYDTLRVYCNIDPAYSSVNCSFGIYYYDDPKDSTPTVRATFQSGNVYPTTPGLTYYDISLSKVTMKGKLYISGNPGLQVMYWTLVKK